MLELSETTDGKRLLVLPPTLDHAILCELKSVLLEGLANGQDLDVDMSGVQRISTPAVQVLIAGRASGGTTDRGEMRLISPSPIVSEFANTLALEEALGLTEMSL